MKSTKYFRERIFFRHLVASLEYPKCLFLAHCRVLSHLLNTLGQYLVFVNCENWLVLHSTLLHVWLQVTFASSKPGLLVMRNQKKEKTDLVSSAWICLVVWFLNKETDLGFSPVETPPSWGIHPGPHRTFETLSPPEFKSESKAESKSESKGENEIVQVKSYWGKCRYVCFPYYRWVFWMLAETFRIVGKRMK